MPTSKKSAKKVVRKPRPAEPVNVPVTPEGAYACPIHGQLPRREPSEPTFAFYGSRETAAKLDLFMRKLQREEQLRELETEVVEARVELELAETRLEGFKRLHEANPLD